MIAYLDNSATTRPTEQVVEAMRECMLEGYFNPSSVYAPAVESFRRVRRCREEILRQVHGTDCRAVFTSGGTESNNLAVLGTVEKMRGRQVVAVSAVEHPSVLQSFEKLAAMGHDVRILPVNGEGELDYDALEKALQDGCSFVSCMQVNNETGALLDAKRLYETVRGRAIVHVDGVQGFMRVPFDMRWADIYTLSGHKIHGPKGIGCMVFRKNVRFAARNIGGGQEETLRSGTENTPGIAGLYAAVTGLQNAPDPMEKKRYLLEKFKQAVPELLVNGPDPEHAAPHIINLSFPGVRGETMLHALEAEQVYASTGSACSSKKRKVSAVLTAMGVNADRAEWALRFSLSPYTAFEEIDHAAEVLKNAYEQLRRFQRR